MKRKNKYIFLGLALSFLLGGSAQAQSLDKLLLFSQDQMKGSARIQAMGGAQISLGGDLSALQGNPAGLGFYNRSEMSITPSLGVYNSRSSYGYSSVNDYKVNANIQNGALIMAGDRDYSTSALWRGGTFGVSFNRTSDYNQRFSYRGFNDYNSIADYFIQRANQLPLETVRSNGDYEEMAYNTFLINPGGDGRFYYPSDSVGYPEQEETVTRSGSKYDWNFSYGGNIDDFLYFGVGMGVVSFDYTQENNYLEFFPEGDIIEIDLQDRLNVEGDGINLTAGLIARPMNRLTVGASFTSPTFYTIEQESYSDMIVFYDNLPFLLNDTTINLYEEYDESALFYNKYSMATPMKLSAGLTYFFGKQGFISSDIDFIDYSTIRLSDQNGTMTELQEAIQDTYRPKLNFRLGGEWRHDIFRLRGGFALKGSPYKDRSWGDSHRYTIGAGIRQASYFIDFALVHSRAFTSYSRYTMQPEYDEYGEQIPLTYSKEASILHKNTQALVTLGWLF